MARTSCTWLEAPLYGLRKSTTVCVWPGEHAAFSASIAMRNAEILGRVNNLPRRDANILRLRFGLNGRPPMTLDQVATLLGISGERVRQIQTRAFKELRCLQLLSYL